MEGTLDHKTVVLLEQVTPVMAVKVAALRQETTELAAKAVHVTVPSTTVPPSEVGHVGADAEEVPAVVQTMHHSEAS